MLQYIHSKNEPKYTHTHTHVLNLAGQPSPQFNAWTKDVLGYLPITSKSFRIIIIKQNKPLTSLTILFSCSSVSLFALLVLLLFKIQELERGNDNISNPFPANLLYQGNPRPFSAGINTTFQLGRMVWTYWLKGRTWAFLDHSNISTLNSANVTSSRVYIHNSSLG